MTAADTTGVDRIAAETALAVPGVAELQPSLRHSLAGAASRVRRTLSSPALPPETGVHTDHTPETGTWHVEVRCVLHDDRRALDTARDVREHVRSAVVTHLNRHGRSGPVSVVVTVTRIRSRRRAATA